MTLARPATDRQPWTPPVITRRVPLVPNGMWRTVVGVAVLAASAAGARVLLAQPGFGAPEAVLFLAWLPGVLLADKFAHKYPQRYFTYLAGAHLKAALVSAVVLGIVGLAAGRTLAPPLLLWTAFGIMVVLDAVVSALNRTGPPVAVPPLDARGTASHAAASAPELSAVNSAAVFAALPGDVDEPLAVFIRQHLPASEIGLAGVQLVRDAAAVPTAGMARGLIVCGPRLNDIRRLNRFLLGCAAAMPMGGYLAARYVGLDQVKEDLARKYPGPLGGLVRLLHFAWRRAAPKLPGINRVYFALTNGRNRVLSKVEIWGRLAYCGMHVIEEAPNGRETLLLARRVAPPVANRRPSYYPVVALEKVGLDGAPLRTHKLRSMFPFSEFLQKRIFEDHGLATTGKFANDYRLTEYGPFLRRYWLDELPQVFDWIRGDVKLVGMRATSRHYLTLYPQELHDLYVQTKPGLIPPIFDESNPGLDGIIAVELTYLQRYWQSPFRTDVRYLLQTFSDIFLRGVRSK